MLPMAWLLSCVIHGLLLSALCNRKGGGGFLRCYLSDIQGPNGTSDKDWSIIVWVKWLHGLCTDLVWHGYRFGLKNRFCQLSPRDSLHRDRGELLLQQMGVFRWCVKGSHISPLEEKGIPGRIGYAVAYGDTSPESIPSEVSDHEFGVFGGYDGSPCSAKGSISTAFTALHCRRREARLRSPRTSLIFRNSSGFVSLCNRLRPQHFLLCLQPELFRKGCA